MPKQKISPSGDSVQLIEKRLLEKRTQLLAEIRKIEQELETIREIKRRHFGTSSEEPLYRERVRVPLSPDVVRFLQEEIVAKGRREFSAAEVKDYLIRSGRRGRWIYTTVYEYLKRMELQGKLRKSGKLFRLVRGIPIA